jgi:hypothetical protein
MQGTVGALPETLLSHQTVESKGREARYCMAYLEAVSFQAGVPVTPTAQDSPQADVRAVAPEELFHWDDLVGVAEPHRRRLIRG